MDKDYEFFCPKGKRIFNSLLEVKMCSCPRMHKNCPNNISHSYKEGTVCEYLDGHTPRDTSRGVCLVCVGIVEDGEQS